MKNRKSFQKISVQFLAYLKKIEAQAKSIFLIKKWLFINIKKLSSYCCSHGVRTTPNKNKPYPSHNPPLKSNLSDLLQKNFLFPTSSPTPPHQGKSGACHDFVLSRFCISKLACSVGSNSVVLTVFPKFNRNIHIRNKMHSITKILLANQ